MESSRSPERQGWGAMSVERLERFQHRGELRRNVRYNTAAVRADQSSFPTPLAVTEALLPLCQLSGDTDRIYP